MAQRVSLCKDCHCCPAVEVHPGEGVWIGEEGNQVKLSQGEWNTLVELVRKGELREIE